MQHLLPFASLNEYLDRPSVYYLNNQKVKVLHTQRHGDETVYRYMQEDGKEGQVVLSNEEADEYLVPTSEPFEFKKKAAPKAKAATSALYNVVCMYGGRVRETLRAGLPKARAYALANYIKQRAKPGGEFGQYRADWVQVTPA